MPQPISTAPIFFRKDNNIFSNEKKKFSKELEVKNSLD